MRQLCLSADMVPTSYLEDLRKPPPSKDVEAISADSLSSEEKDRLISALKQAVADQEECIVRPRGKGADFRFVTMCSTTLGSLFADIHVSIVLLLSSLTPLPYGNSLTPVCLACIAETIRRQHLCPMDRYPLNESSLLELPADATVDISDEAVIQPPKRSAKINELLRYLKAFDRDDKTLVFSQFTTFLDRVAAVLQEEGIPFCRFDGSMSSKKVDYDIVQC